MVYKDENKRKQAQRERSRRFRNKHKGVTKQGVPSIGTVTPEGPKAKVPPNYGLDNCLCLHCVQNKGKRIINHGKRKLAHELGENEVNRVSLPGDIDYGGVAHSPTGYIDGIMEEQAGDDKARPATGATRTA